MYPDVCTAVQSQKAVSAYFTSEQILPFGFVVQFIHIIYGYNPCCEITGCNIANNELICPPPPYTPSDHQHNKERCRLINILPVQSLSFPVTCVFSVVTPEELGRLSWSTPDKHLQGWLWLDQHLLNELSRLNSLINNIYVAKDPFVKASTIFLNYCLPSTHHFF